MTNHPKAARTALAHLADSANHPPYRAQPEGHVEKNWRTVSRELTRLYTRESHLEAIIEGLQGRQSQVMMAETECGEIPPNVKSPVPCHLEPGHSGQHFSTSGCAGSEIHWPAPSLGAGSAEGLAAAIAPCQLLWGWKEPFLRLLANHFLASDWLAEHDAELARASTADRERVAMVADEIEDPRTQRPGMQRRRIWAAHLRAALATPASSVAAGQGEVDRRG